MDVSKNRGTPNSSILIGFSIIFTIHFGGFPPIFGNTHINWLAGFLPSTVSLRSLRRVPGYTNGIKPLPKNSQVDECKVPMFFEREWPLMYLEIIQPTEIGSRGKIEVRDWR